MEEFVKETPAPKAYLTQSQIEAVREEIEHITGIPSDYAKLLSMVDHYVHVNEMADDQYTMFFQSLANFERLYEQAGLVDPIRSTIPLLSGLCLFDLLVLVGVIGEEEMSKGQDAFFHAFRNDKGTPQA